MKLQKASELFNAIQGVPFGTLFTDRSLHNIRLDKGSAGKLLENSLGLSNGNANIDFEDGELKSYKCKPDGSPRETIAITQILTHIDDLTTCKPFKDTWLYEKIRNVLYVPACKDDPSSANWFFCRSTHIDLESEEYADLYSQLKADYELICHEIQNRCINKKQLSTISGKYLQIRTKNNGTIFSKVYNHQLTDGRNYAFYFKTDFMKDFYK
jgi:DNA mismatch repair protein MutH